MHRRTRTALLVAATLALAALGGVAFLAWTNYERADRWERRAASLERTADSLSELLAERSGELNARTRELNALAEKVGEATEALSRSEADVASLASRQRELADEKAQVEDERAHVAAQAERLDRVASSTIVCKQGLIELLNALNRDDDATAQARWSGVAASCDAAEAELQAYLAGGR